MEKIDEEFEPLFDSDEFIEQLDLDNLDLEGSTEVCTVDKKEVLDHPPNVDCPTGPAPYLGDVKESPVLVLRGKRSRPEESPVLVSTKKRPIPEDSGCISDDGFCSE